MDNNDQNIPTLLNDLLAVKQTIIEAIQERHSETFITSSHGLNDVASAIAQIPNQASVQCAHEIGHLMINNNLILVSGIMGDKVEFVHTSAGITTVQATLLERTDDNPVPIPIECGDWIMRLKDYIPSTNDEDLYFMSMSEEPKIGLNPRFYSVQWSTDPNTIYNNNLLTGGSWDGALFNRTNGAVIHVSSSYQGPNAFSDYNRIQSNHNILLFPMIYAPPYPPNATSTSSKDYRKCMVQNISGEQYGYKQYAAIFDSLCVTRTIDNISESVVLGSIVNAHDVPLAFNFTDTGSGTTYNYGILYDENGYNVYWNGTLLNSTPLPAEINTKGYPDPSITDFSSIGITSVRWGGHIFKTPSSIDV